MWAKWSWIKRESLSAFRREKKGMKRIPILFVVEFIPNPASGLQWDPCSTPGQTNMLMSDMPAFFIFLTVLFKVCQEVHRGERVSSLLNPEPLVSHHITNLPPPAVCADPATKRLLPGCCTRALQELFCADSHQTSDCSVLPAPLAPASASQEAAEAGRLYPLTCSGCLCSRRVSTALFTRVTSSYNFYVWEDS